MNLGMPEMIFIFLMALLIFGPRKLPEVGRQIGKALAEFKRASNSFKSQLDQEMRNLELEEAAKKPPMPPSIQPPERTIAAEPGAGPADASAPARPIPCTDEATEAAFAASNPSPDEAASAPVVSPPEGPATAKAAADA